MTIEGNIGSGKSTLLQNLARALPPESVVFIPEPVDEWLEHGLLQALYDGHLPAEVFQYAALAGVTHKVHRALQSVTSDTKLILAERSLFSNKEVFAKAVMPNVISRGAFDYTWSQALESLPALNFKHIYVRASPRICLRRVALRDRDSEDTISIEYLQLLSDLHEDWFARELDLDTDAANWLMLDGASPPAALMQDALRHLLHLML